MNMKKGRLLGLIVLLGMGIVGLSGCAGWQMSDSSPSHSGGPHH